MLESVTISIIGLVIDSNLRKRKIENELISNYIEYALTREVGDRKRLSEYFSTVISSGEQRKRWKKYDSLVSIQLKKTQDALKKNNSPAYNNRIKKERNCKGSL